MLENPTEIKNYIFYHVENLECVAFAENFLRSNGVFNFYLYPCV